jgi:hypothetical protein
VAFSPCHTSRNGRAWVFGRISGASIAPFSGQLHLPSVECQSVINRELDFPPFAVWYPTLDAFMRIPVRDLSGPEPTAANCERVGLFRVSSSMKSRHSLRKGMLLVPLRPLFVASRHVAMCQVQSYLSRSACISPSRYAA